MNTAPVLSSLAPVTINEGTTSTVTLQATDAENDPLVFSLVGAPAWASLAGNVITLSPDFSSAGAVSITVIVTDGQLQASGMLSITVVNVNRAPVLMPLSAVTLTAGTTQQVMLMATDPDGDAITLTLTNAPAFASLMGTTLSLAPAANVVDSRMMSVTASDPSNASDTRSFQLMVNAPANAAPLLSGLNQIDSANMNVAAGAMVATVPSLRASVDDPENAQVRLEAEVVATAASFTNMATHTGALSPEGLITLPLPSLPPGNYKWQLRALDAAGTASAWTAFNGGATAFTLVAGSISGGVSINANAAATNSTNVTLSITASTTAPATVTEMCFSNDGVTFIDCGAPVTTKAWTMSSGDGTKTVRVRVRNSLNQTLVLNDSIVLDTAPPQISNFVVNSSAVATNMTTVSLTWSATDALTGVQGQQASNDGVTFSAISASPAVFMLQSTQGQRTVTLKVTDLAGNEATASDTIFFDSSPPTISSAVLNGGAGWTNSTSVTLAVTAVDGATSSGLFQVCVSGSVTPGCVASAASVPVTLTTGNGMKTVLITVSDNAGNVSLASMASIGLDQSAPSISGLNVNASAAFTNSANVQVAAFANDTGGSGLSQVECQTDLGAFAAPVPFAAMVAHTLTGSDGTKTVGCRVIDGAGNQSGIATDTITLDRAAPTGSVIINAGNPGFTNSTMATLILTAMDANGVSHYCANATGTPPSGPTDSCFIPLATTAFTLPAGDGLKTVSVFFRDGAGNVSSAITDTITLDTVAPTVSVSAAGLGIAFGAASTNQLTPVFAHSANDATAGLFQVCTGLMTPPTTCVAWTPNVSIALGAGDGPRTGYLRVIDNAGNLSAIVSDDITLDQTAPTVSGVSINGGATYTNTPNVTVTHSSTDAVGVLQMQVSTNGPAAFGAPFAWAASTPVALPSGDGTKTVLLRTIDGAGNTSGAGSDTIILDTTPPTVAISINSGARYSTTATVTVAFSPTESGSGLAQRCIKEVAVGAPAPASPTAADPCFVLYTSTAMHTLAAIGDRRLYVWLLDGAGNVTTTPATGDIWFDNVSPGVPSGVSATAGHRTLTIAFSNVSDGSSGVQGYEIGLSRTSGGPYLFGAIVPGGAGTTSVNLTLPNGVGQFAVVRAVDNAGNRSTNSVQVSGTPRWPFVVQNRPAGGGIFRSVALQSTASRYFAASTGGGLWSSDDGFVTFTRRDPMTDQQLNDVYVDPSGDVWTVGRFGHVARSTDDGVTFDVLTNNDALARDLQAVTFAGTTGAPPLTNSWWVAVGSGGRIVRGSANFLNAVPTFDIVTSGVTANLVSVTRCASLIGACASGGVLVAVGVGGTVVRSTDSGASWTTVSLPAGYSTVALNSVHALANSNTVFIGAVAPSGQGALLQSTNGGSSFVELSGFGDLTEITDLSSTGTELWGSGRSPSSVVFRYVGTTRTDATLPSPASGNAVTALVARSSLEVATVGSGGDFMLSTGLTFAKRNLGASTTFFTRIAMPATFGSTAWAVGGSGDIAFTSNAGTTWTQQAPGLTPNTLTAVEAFDTGGGVAGTLLFAVGAGGQIFKSTNGGTAWAADPDTGIVTASLFDVACRSATSCVSVGSASTVLTWGGTNWVVTSTGGPRTYRAVTAYGSSGTNRAVAVGLAGALQTQTGSTWTVRTDISANDFRGVAHKTDAAGTVIAVGTSGALFKSVDHGQTFTARSSGVVATLNDVSNVPGTSTWYVSGSGGTLLKSIDDGETWSQLVSNTTVDLAGVCTGAVSTRVWAVGSGATILFSSTSGQ